MVINKKNCNVYDKVDGDGSCEIINVYDKVDGDGSCEIITVIFVILTVLIVMIVVTK
jgi:hypothetical protein